jgi:hypothetical protein
MPRGGEEPRGAAMEQRVRRRPEGMQPRTPVGAHPWGTRQRWGAAGSCLMRGREQVRTECSWTVLADHRRRVVHLVARPRRLAARGGDERGARVVVWAGWLSGREGSMALPARGGWQHSKTCSGGF